MSDWELKDIFESSLLIEKGAKYSFNTGLLNHIIQYDSECVSDKSIKTERLHYRVTIKVKEDE